jgi:branched-subunit amino acid aminotransferase/4-amino-4-deoxychorismate lyase
MTESKYIWMDGEFVAWHDAKVHVLSHTLTMEMVLLKVLKLIKQ